jgi:glycine hydroxymethyltransferase
MPIRFLNLEKKDKKLSDLIKKEIRRQSLTINLIPSENIVPLEILEAVGSPLMNKYSEGYPGKRYYPGNEIYDEIENLCKERALEAFKLDPNEWHVNVQSYSGSPANFAIYSALMEPGDTLLGMKLSHGGHLSHGHKASLTFKIWRSVHYGVDPITHLIDYGELRQIALKEKPKVIVSGYTAYPRKVNFEAIGKICREVGAYHLADISHISGLIISGLHPSPFEYADVVMTTTHKTLRGPRGAVIFCRKELSDKIDRAVFPGLQGGPHNNITAAKALAFYLAKKPQFKKYQINILDNAKILAEELLKRGFNLVSGGTDTHLILVDIKNKGLDGMRAEYILESAGIIANRNSVPGDESPFKPSGLRLGTPAVTARGMKKREMKIIADWIDRLITKNEDPRRIKKEVENLCAKFPLPY